MLKQLRTEINITMPHLVTVKKSTALKSHLANVKRDAARALTSPSGYWTLHAGLQCVRLLQQTRD